MTLSRFGAIAAAIAACVAPSGSYTGGGVAVVSVPDGMKLSSLSSQQLFLNYGGGGVFLQSLTKLTGVKGAIDNPDVVAAALKNHWASSYSARTDGLTSLFIKGRFDTVLCTGLPATTESVAYRFTVPAADAGVPTKATIARIWLLSVSDSGRVINLTPYDSSVQEGLGFSVRQERQ